MSAFEVTRLLPEDPEVISAAFSRIGWEKPVGQFRRYLAEQAAGERVVLVARVGHAFAGYLTLLLTSAYRPFAERGIPEIQDLNVLPEFRRRGIATALLREAEMLAAKHHDAIGIGVALHRDYGPAQRLYIKLGFIPDGRGVAYDARTLEPMKAVPVDDRLTLYLTKSLWSATTTRRPE